MSIEHCPHYSDGQCNYEWNWGKDKHCNGGWKVCPPPQFICPTCGSPLQRERNKHWTGKRHIDLLRCENGLTDEQKEKEWERPKTHPDGSSRVFYVRSKRSTLHDIVLVRARRLNWKENRRVISISESEKQWILSKADIPPKLKKKLEGVYQKAICGGWQKAHERRSEEYRQQNEERERWHRR